MNRKWLYGMGAALIGACVVLSFLTLSRFPAVNVDEVDNAILAHRFIEAGRLDIPFMKDVIDPRFSELSAADQGSLRGVYAGILGLVELSFGNEFFVLRLFSFLVWVGLTVLLFFLARKHQGPGPAVLTVMLWTFSFEVLLSSHLIRPDILLAGVFMLLTALCMEFFPLPRAFSSWIAGFISAAALGIHPHGLLLPLFLILIQFDRIFLLKKKPLSGLWLAMGILTGVGAAALLADWPTYFLSRYTYMTGLFAEKSGVWVERILPWNLLGDAGLNLLKPESFYFTAATRIPSLWWAAGVSQLVLCAGALIWGKEWVMKDTFYRLLYIGAVFCFFALGYGHIRPEIIYNGCLFLFTLPLLSSVLCKHVMVLSRERDRLSFLCAGLGVLLSLFIFRHLVLIFLFAFLGVMALEKKSDRKILLGTGIGLFVVFCLWVRDAGHMKLLNGIFIQGVLSFTGMALLTCATGLFWAGRKAWNRTQASVSLMKVSVLAGCLGITAVASVVHHLDFTSRNPPLQDTFNQAGAFVPAISLKVLGPQFFWFKFGDSFRDVDALVMDHYYSGRKRPWECIERYKPDILIVDENFVRRFMPKDNPSLFFKVPFNVRGVVPSNFHHSELKIVELYWPQNSR